MKEIFEQEENLQLLKDIFIFTENVSDPIMTLRNIFGEREDMGLIERMYYETKEFLRMNEKLYDYYIDTKVLVYDYIVINPYYELIDIIKYLDKEKTRYNTLLIIKSVIDCESELENIDTIDETLEEEIIEMLNDEIEEWEE